MSLEAEKGKEFELLLIGRQECIAESLGKLLFIYPELTHRIQVISHLMIGLICSWARRICKSCEPMIL